MGRVGADGNGRGGYEFRSGRRTGGEAEGGMCESMRGSNPSWPQNFTRLFPVSGTKGKAKYYKSHTERK